MAHPAAMERNGVSDDFQIDKDVAVRCWRQVLEVAHAAGVDDKVLAAEAGISASYFSRVSAGEQGDLLGLILELGKLRPALSRDFICRLHDRAMQDPMTVAVDDLATAALRFLRLRGSFAAAAAGGAR